MNGATVAVVIFCAAVAIGVVLGLWLARRRNSKPRNYDNQYGKNQR
jgi:uncharacterized protein YneF (UPF0154 family)